MLNAMRIIVFIVIFFVVSETMKINYFFSVYSWQGGHDALKFQLVKLLTNVIIKQGWVFSV
ncbi:hypothetical protein BZG02_16415 [Labilibaculum filiforme]|uniref:Uncharacterized protein n=1 Tax=Labilibaculum filiforme TaxID=1940526 RepID=A0A2N3HT46_9BACT|nr:hypothetical protein BZG02_16415 [Labilibaculum filiforme]